MKYRHIAVLFGLLTTAPAFAAPVVMVQFGSFETQAEAQKRLSDLAASNPSVFSTLSASVREVKLPPDNLTVYRTQAGPLESRASAQSLCNRLAGNGSECYVVETALSAPAAAPALTNAALAPKVNPAVEAKATGDMQDALTRAAVLQNSGGLSNAPAVAVAPKAAPEPEKSFWSRINPFSTTPPAPKPVVVAKPVLEEKLPTAAPVMEVAAAPLAPVVEAPKVVVAAPVVSAPVVTAPVVAVAEPVVITPKAPLVPMSLTGSNLQPRLLPPPAPLTDKDKRILETTPAPVRLAAPVVESPIALSTPTHVATAPTVGSVNVEEAKRVPVTETVSVPQARGGVLIPPAVSALPSSTLGQKTLWAQVGQFANSEEALVFWDQYRRAHPDFPALRVRVVSSLQQQMRGNDHVWLRVGPFSREGFIESLCSSINGADTASDAVKAKRCGRITDIGIAAKSTFTQPRYPQGSRYKR